MRAQAFQSVNGKDHITIKQQHEGAIRFIQPFVKVRLSCFVSFCCSDKERANVTRSKLHILDTIAAFSNFKLVADCPDITRTYILFFQLLNNFLGGEFPRPLFYYVLELPVVFVLM